MRKAAKFAVVQSLLLGVSIALLVGCAAGVRGPGAVDGNWDGNVGRDSNSLLIVDCLLPGQVRQLGTRMTYQSPRRPIKSSAANCQIRGGEYVAYDRANFSTALKIWLPRAQEGDPEAQTYVGEIYEKGMGLDSDYTLAAQWYQKAAEQLHSRAMINLGYLHETGLGVDKDLTVAMNYYRSASGITDGDLEYVSSIEFANRVEAKAETAGLKAQVKDLSKKLANTEIKYLQEQKTLTEQQQALLSLKRKIERQKQRVVAAPTTLDATQAEPTAGYLKQIDILKNQLALAQTEEGNLRVALKSRQSETTKLRQEYAQSNQELYLAQEEMKQKQIAIEQLESRVAVAGSDQSQQQRRLKVSEAQVEQLKERIAALRAMRSSSDTELENSVSVAQGRESDITQQLDQQADLIADLRRQRSAIETKYQRSIAQLQSQILAGREEQQRLTGQLSTASVLSTEQANENNALRAELDKQTQAVAEREQEQKRLTDRFAAMQLANSGAGVQRKELLADLSRSGAALSTAKLEQTRLTNRLLNQQLIAQKNERAAAQDLALLEGELSEREAELNLQSQRLVALESDVSRARAQLNDSPREQIAQVVASGPLIDIINPPVLATRGTPTLSARKDGTLELIGKVAPAEKLLTFNINGQPQSLNKAGVFKYLSNDQAQNLELVAVDDDGKDTRLNLRIDKRNDEMTDRTPSPTTEPAEQTSGKGIEFGKYYALIIGNNRYASLSDLNTAENDARVLDRLLRVKYGFQTELLINASRIDMLTALNRLRESLTPQDNLLVYYAGHGELDKVNQRGYWLPVDADASDTQNWVSNSAVTEFLDTMAAKHILVIADSCYSGTMTRSSLARRQPDMTADVRSKWLKAISRSKVRAVLSSGGVKPVYDGSRNARHSLFAEVFIDELSNNSVILEGYSLFYKLQQRVNTAASNLGVEQNPQYSPIKHAGHEAGEFLFVPEAVTKL